MAEKQAPLHPLERLPRLIRPFQLRKIFEAALGRVGAVEIKREPMLSLIENCACSAWFVEEFCDAVERKCGPRLIELAELARQHRSRDWHEGERSDVLESGGEQKSLP